MRDNVWANVSDNVRDNVVFESFSTNDFTSNGGWVSFYDFFTETKVLNNDTFNEYKSHVPHLGFLSMLYENVAIVVRNPIKVTKDSNGLMHSTTEPAIIFANGLGLNYIHGREVPNKYFDIENISKDMFLMEENENYRAAMYEILGEEKVLNLLGAEVVHQKVFKHRVLNRDQECEIEEETLILYKTKEVFFEIDNQPYAWVKYICPSTNSNYLIACDPKYSDVEEAAKSLTEFEWEEGETYEWNARS